MRFFEAGPMSIYHLDNCLQKVTLQIMGTHQRQSETKTFDWKSYYDWRGPLGMWVILSCPEQTITGGEEPIGDDDTEVATAVAERDDATHWGTSSTFRAVEIDHEADLPGPRAQRRHKQIQSQLTRRPPRRNQSKVRSHG